MLKAYLEEEQNHWNITRWANHEVLCENKKSKGLSLSAVGERWTLPATRSHHYPIDETHRAGNQTGKATGFEQRRAILSQHANLPRRPKSSHTERGWFPDHLEGNATPIPRVLRRIRFPKMWVRPFGICHMCFPFEPEISFKTIQSTRRGV